MKVIDLREKGITLIALVVTIIILLILAGVTVGLVTSGTGLFDKAKEAKDKWQNVQDQENYLLGNYENQINSYVRNGDSSINYSDQEQEIGTWMGNSKLYQKTFSAEVRSTQLDSNNQIIVGTIPTGAIVRNIQGITYWGDSNGVIYSGGNELPVSGSQCTTFFNNGNIYYENRGTGTFTVAYVITVQYTK